MGISNYNKTCDLNRPSNRALFLIELNSISSVTITSGEVSNINLDSGTSFQKIEADLDTIIRTESINTGSPAFSYKHNVEFILSKLRLEINDLHDQLEAASPCGIVAIVVDSNNQSWLVGWNYIEEYVRALALESVEIGSPENVGNFILGSISECKDIPLDETQNDYVLGRISDGYDTLPFASDLYTIFNEVDFNNRTIEPYTNAMTGVDYGASIASSPGSIVALGSYTVLEQSVDLGNNAGDDINALVGNYTPQKEIWLTSIQAFKPGFLKNAGGKIGFGMAGFNANGYTYNGSSYPVGGAEYPINPNMGWTSRGAFDNIAGEHGGYVYHHDQPSAYGSHWNFNKLLDLSGPSQASYLITIRIKMNTVSSPGNGNNDGIYEMFLGNECVYSSATMKFREYEEVEIDLYLMGIFFGGGAGQEALRDEWVALFWTKEWAPDVDHPQYGAGAVGLGNTTDIPGTDDAILTTYPPVYI